MANPTESDAVRTKDPLEQLFAEFQSPLLGYAYQLIQDVNIAQDLVQEAFMRLHTHFHSIEQPRPWLYRTVHNLAMNHHRAGRKIVPLSPDDQSILLEQQSGRPEEIPDQHLQRLERTCHLQQCVHSLPDKSQEIIRLKFEENLSYHEISLRTGISVANVGFRLHQAIKQLALEVHRKEIP